jgi:20S proteasome alpha/beta subunit
MVYTTIALIGRHSMISTVGLCGPDWVIVAADSSVSSSIICMSDEFDRIIEIDGRDILAMVGDTGDCLTLGEFIQGNVALYKYRNSIELSTTAISHFLRSVLAKNARKSPYEVNLLLAGHDGKPHLYYLDHLGTLQPIPYGAQGYASYFVLSVFDKLYKKDLTFEEGKQVVKAAIEQIKRRFTVNPREFITKVVDKDGIRRIELD